jgi:hypothetical protein
MIESKPGVQSDLKSLFLLESESKADQSPDESLTEDGPHGIEGENVNPLLKDIDSLLGPVHG